MKKKRKLPWKKMVEIELSCGLFLFVCLFCTKYARETNKLKILKMFCCDVCVCVLPTYRNKNRNENISITTFSFYDIVQVVLIKRDEKIENI